MSMKPFKVYIFILQDKLNVWNFFEYVDNSNCFVYNLGLSTFRSYSQRKTLATYINKFSPSLMFNATTSLYTHVIRSSLSKR